MKLANLDYLDKHSIVGRYSWDIFVDSIKNKYRFHTDMFVKSILKDYCPYLVRVLKKGNIYYRARISSADGFKINEMGAPPKKIASAGRINPEGMSYLYLADRPDTTVYETRASLHDYICIGKFELIKDISVINLTGLDQISVFNPELDYLFHAINRGHLKKNEELAKSVRSSDSDLDYLPTQYICDYIKSIRLDENVEEKAYQGIMYKSTMISYSYNIAIFDPTVFECVGIEVREVTKVEYGY